MSDRTHPGINREAYRAAQDMILADRWRVDLGLGRIWSNLRSKWIGFVSPLGYVDVQPRVAPGRYPLIRAHRVIWESVHGEIPDLMQINHIDGVKSNNRLANLELVTARQNIKHALTSGLRLPLAGARNGQSKLTDEQVVEIRRLIAQRVSQTLIAERFGIEQSLVSQIKRGRAWRHLPCEPDLRRSRLTLDTVEAVRSLVGVGLSHQKIADRTGISRQQVSRMMRKFESGEL